MTTEISTPVAPGPGVSPVAQSQTNAATVSADYVKALAELARNLNGRSKAVASFVVAAVLFFFAAGLAGVEHSVTTKVGTETDNHRDGRR